MNIGSTIGARVEDRIADELGDGAGDRIEGPIRGRIGGMKSRESRMELTSANDIASARQLLCMLARRV
eukprot:3973283-Alexandrium_andersonii.AAC.1